MQDIKVYIVIENKKTGDETNISGSLELLRAFLSGVGSFEMQSLPAHVDPSPLAVPVQSATKRKPAKPIPQTI